MAKLNADQSLTYDTNSNSEFDEKSEIWEKHKDYKNQVYTLPRHLDEKVAKLHLDKVGATLTKLSKEQADYIGVPVQGPFKSDNYRY